MKKLMTMLLAIGLIAAMTVPAFADTTPSKPSAVQKVSVTLGGNGPWDHSPKVTWSKVKGAAGYEVYRTVADKNSWKKVRTTTKRSFTDDEKYGWSFEKNYEYKVRAYRKVKGKHVHGKFSKAAAYTPDWTIEELMAELIPYGESIKGQRLQYAGTPGEFIPYHGIHESKYSMKHVTGYTPENSSWTARWPEYISPYEKKADILKMLKKGVKWNIEEQMEANPLCWDPADPDTWDYWSGVDSFTLYARPSGNGYNFWVMF